MKMVSIPNFLPILSIEWRLLYLIYIHQPIPLKQLDCYFSPNEHTDLRQKIKTAILSKNIIDTAHGYCTNVIENSLFLKPLHQIYSTPFPITRTELRNTIKNHALCHILQNLIQAQIIFEYRTELSKKNYLIPCLQKEKYIDQIQTRLEKVLKQSNTTQDQRHLIMIHHTQSQNPIILPKMTITKNEKLLLCYLYQNIEIRTRKIGKSEEYISTELFAKNTQKTQKTILSLIQKQLIQCSYHNYYYINPHLVHYLKPYIDQYKPIYEKHKLMAT